MRPPSGTPGRPGKAWIVSVAVHALVIAGVLAYALLAPEPPPTVAVFELVQAERPKLRPLAPKAPEPPPEKPPEESRPPEAPAPVVKPKQPPAPPKPEPKTARPVSPDTTLPVRDVPPQNAVPKSALVAPSDPRLALWAGRVQRRVETNWNPPSGIDVKGHVKTIVSFEVDRSGKISAVTVTASSGNALLDDLAKRTILRIPQVLPIPETFPGDLLKVSYEFVYNGD
jgi:protein TonB